jgi:hypothetical protein
VSLSVLSLALSLQVMRWLFMIFFSVSLSSFFLTLALTKLCFGFTEIVCKLLFFPLI